MTPDPILIEQIVAAVESRLRDDLAGVGGVPLMAGGAEGEVVCVERVVTGEMLVECLEPESRQLRIGADSILTPSAREVIAQHELAVTVDGDLDGADSAAGLQRGSGWSVLLAGSDVSDLRGMNSQRCDDLDSALSSACQRLSSAGCSGVVVLCSDPHRFACLANRRPEVRAVVVRDAQEATRLIGRMGANLVLVCPLAAGAWRSRQIVEACLSGDPPQVPSDWPSQRGSAETETRS